MTTMMKIPGHHVRARARAERIGGTIDVPAALMQQALTIAGVTDPSELGETELDAAQVDALANLLGFRSNRAFDGRRRLSAR